MRDPRIEIERIKGCYEGKFRYVLREPLFKEEGRYVRLRDL